MEKYAAESFISLLRIFLQSKPATLVTTHSTIFQLPDQIFWTGPWGQQVAAGRWELLLALGRLDLLRALDLVWPENTSGGGSGGEVEAITPPCLCALFIIYDPQGPQPLAFLENGGCQEQ